MTRVIFRFKTLSVLSLAAVLVTLSHSTLVAVPAEQVSAASNECADGIDNDFDGRIDYPQDGECLSLHDNSEGPTGRGLFLSVSDGLTTVKQNGHMTYRITLQTERDEQKNVDVHFFIPHQTNLISASNAGRKEGDYVVWRNVTVYPGRARELTVNVGVKPRTPVDLLVIAEVTSSGEKATDTTRVVENPDGHRNRIVKLSVTDGKAYAEPNEKLTYRIVVDNTNGGAKSYRLRSTLPTSLNFVSASGNPSRDNRALTWPKANIAAGEVHEYYLVGEIEREAVQDSIIQLRVSTEETFASDSTSVHTGVLDSAFTVRVTDGFDVVPMGEIVTYDINVRNRTNQLATEVDVNNALPSHTEFVAASEGGYWTGKNIRWTGLTVSPHGERVLKVQARVRSDAPRNHILRNSVEVRGNTGVDTTRVGDAITYSGRAPVHTQAPIVLRKTADRAEVQPGDTVGYTIYLRNNTNKPFTNVVVQDRMDTNYMQVLGSEYGSMNGNSLHWNIPVLAPGQEWTVRYTVAISPHAPRGTTINNVVTVRGDGLETISLTERVFTGETGVITSLPPTGVGFGGVFVALTGLLGLAQTGLVRRRIL